MWGGMCLQIQPGNNHATTNNCGECVSLRLPEKNGTKARVYFLLCMCVCVAVRCWRCEWFNDGAGRIRGMRSELYVFGSGRKRFLDHVRGSGPSGSEGNQNQTNSHSSRFPPGLSVLPTLKLPPKKHECRSECVCVNCFVLVCEVGGEEILESFQ